jgi:hypothetical protein
MRQFVLLIRAFVTTLVAKNLRVPAADGVGSTVGSVLLVKPEKKSMSKLDATKTILGMR